jgi:hypothetical protein
VPIGNRRSKRFTGLRMCLRPVGLAGRPPITFYNKTKKEMSKSDIFWIFYGQFTTVLRTLTSLTSENFVTRPLWGYYPPQSNKKQPLGPLLCQRPGTNPSTARPRPHNTKLEPQPALEVNGVKPATAFGCRSIITAAHYWQMALVTSQAQF